MEKTEEALFTFNDKKNCAQSVLGAYAEDYNLDKVMLYKIATAFGGGMGHTNGICGALSGGLMVLGFKHNKDEFDKETTYTRTRQLMDEFIRRNGTRDCEKLIGVDLTTEEGKKKFQEEGIKKNVCEKCIADVIDIIEDQK
jgi:C_GCAxxG_C_C family probable redox protein